MKYKLSAGATVVFVCLFNLTAYCRTIATDSASTWQLWEHTLTSRKSYSDAYQTLSVAATFTSTDGKSVTVPGLYVSGNTFKIRFAFPASGIWNWKTTCSDAKNKTLHQRSGQVVVTAYKGLNPLYNHGFVRVGDTKRYLVFDDGTPFFWLGDTGWLAFRQSSMTEWKTYIDNRAAKGFTVIQTHASQYLPNDSTQAAISPLKNGLPDPGYFNNLDEKISYANQQGLVVLLVGLGVSGKGHYIPEMNTAAFARYLTARLASHAVIFSPSMDARYDDRNDQMATLLKAASPVHLVTQHVGTLIEAAAAYHLKPSIDFTALQSGHHNGNIAKAHEAAVKWSQNLWQLEPTKPVINSEAMYDGRGSNEGNSWREQDARKLGWMSWLSGALGYTYGAGETDRHVTGGQGGLFRFVKDSTSYDYWRNVLEWPSSTQMSYLKQFFAQIPWWQLEPAPDRIRNQANSPLQTMTLSRSRNGDLVVAYLPDNHSIQMDMNGLQSGLKGYWFNPVQNQYRTVSESIGQAGEQTFRSPGAGDWVLLLRK
jgi:hypothetical protein